MRYYQRLRDPSMRLSSCNARNLIVLVGLLQCAIIANAAAQSPEPAAVVKLLQAPAWLERGGDLTALRRGARIRDGDSVVTGEGARLLVRLEEGSFVKLGANARLNFDQLQLPATPDGIFVGALNVLKGAFRFTTQLADRRREITTQIGTATIGIRGTDVWGKAEASRDFVVLLEGEIEIERNGAQVSLAQPLSLYMAPRDEAALAVAPVDADDLARWAQETEPQAGEGVIDQDGGYRLNLASFRSESAAANFTARLAAAGFASDSVAIDVAGETWWRVRRASYQTRADAEHDAAKLRSVYRLSSPWIDRG